MPIASRRRCLAASMDASSVQRDRSDVSPERRPSTAGISGAALPSWIEVTTPATSRATAARTASNPVHSRKANDESRLGVLAMSRVGRGQKPLGGKLRDGERHHETQAKQKNGEGIHPDGRDERKDERQSPADKHGVMSDVPRPPQGNAISFGFSHPATC